MFSILHTNFVSTSLFSKNVLSSGVQQPKPEKLNIFQHFFIHSVFFTDHFTFKLYYLNITKVLFVLLLKLKSISNFSWEQKLISRNLNSFSFFSYATFSVFNFFHLFYNFSSQAVFDPLALIRLSFQSIYFSTFNRLNQSLSSFAFSNKLKKINLLGDLISLTNQNRNYTFLGIDLDNIELLSKILKCDLNLRMNALYDIYAVDYPNRLKRFEIAYCFLSIYGNFRLFLKGFISDNLYVKSISGTFASANWLEREIWDLFGVFFINHKNLRRILTDYGFKGFPFRKDFPLTGYVEARFDESRYAVVYEPLEIAQEFRVFNFKSPWEV